MSGASNPLLVDTGGFYALYDVDDEHHETVDRLFAGLERGELPYGPVYTTRYVLAELTTLVLYRVGHAEAVTALEEIVESPTVNLLDVGAGVFGQTVDRFGEYDDQEISFVDHLTGTVGDRHGIEHVVALDSDFRTLGFTRVPLDTGEF